MGQVDSKLAEEIDALLKKNLDEKFDPELDPDVDKKTYDKFHGELFGVLCQLTSGEAKSVELLAGCQRSQSAVFQVTGRIFSAGGRGEGIQNSLRRKASSGATSL